MTWRCMKCGWEAGLWVSLNSQRRVRCLGPFYSSRYSIIVRALSHAQIVEGFYVAAHACVGRWKTYKHVYRMLVAKSMAASVQQKDVVIYHTTMYHTV